MALFDVWMGGHEFILDKANLKFNVKFNFKFNLTLTQNLSTNNFQSIILVIEFDHSIFSISSDHTD